MIEARGLTRLEALCRACPGSHDRQLPRQAPYCMRPARVILRYAWLSILFASLLTGCKTKPSSNQPGTASTKAEETIQFESIESRLGVKHLYHNGEETDQFTYLEAMGGGLGGLDYDNDGWCDLFLPSGGKITADRQLQPLPGVLYRNQVAQGEKLIDVTAVACLDKADYYTQGIAVGDVNSDGFADLLVTGYGGMNLFINQGDGTFCESAQALGLIDTKWSSSAAFGDMNSDGLTDLYVAHYVDWSWENHPACKSTAGVKDVCPPAAFTGVRDAVFFNNGDGTFREMTDEVGLVPEGKGLGVLCADLNDDRLVDIYVANDTTNNFLYQNLGDGKFKEVGVSSGTALDDKGVSNGSMGIAVLDYDSNMLPDLWVCNYEDETFALYKNDGEMSFRHVTSSTGLSNLGTLFVAFGTATGDYDHDGDEDIMVANGHVLRFPPGNSVGQLPLLIKSNGKGRLTRVTTADKNNYFAKNWRGRGVVQMDLDRDGDLDLAVSHVNEPAVILRNRSQSSGSWCAIDLVGRQSNRDAVGAKVIFKTDAKRYFRAVVGGGSYMSQSPYTVHCAFPAGETLEQVEVSWPSGKVQTLDKVTLGKSQVIVEEL